MSESRITILVALAANVVLAIAKLVAGLVTGSAALLAEAAHSIADTVDQLALLFSLRMGRRPPDDEHQFGHGMERFFWAFIAAVWIFLAGAVFSIGQGVLALRSPDSSGSTAIGLAVLAVALVAEGTSLLRAVRQVRSGASGSRDSLGRYVRELRDPAPRIVLLEDGAAVIGVILAAAGLIARDLTGNEAYDAAASIAIGVLLIGVAIAVGSHARDLLLGESARPEVREAIEAAALRHPAVEAVPALLTMHIGPDDLLVAANIELRDELTVNDAERIADEIAAELREAEPSVHHVFLQPSPGRPVS
ncbi:MAG TPA: cation diffusion facilitator family transporter [Gaiellales bacterium]|jgi:cation diffusion facilitator family transporter|nr:cation diffusion facilitator family transporter [Gaiellales bacterium]